MDEVDHNEKLIVAKAMKSYGGNFMQSLSACILAADHINLQKLKNTFPKYWNQYLAIGKNGG